MKLDIPRRLRKRRYVALAVILLVILLGPYLVPLPRIGETFDPRELAHEESEFTEVLGLDVHYVRTGEGKTNLVLLHGFGASLFSWREVMDPLSKDFSVLAYDRPAFGLTERPTRGEWGNRNPYSGESQVELLLNLMDGMAIDQAVLVGHSAGAAVAVSAALDHPEKVIGLILVDPALGSHGGMLRYLRWIPQVRRLTLLLVRSIPSWGMDILYDSWYNTSRITDEIVEGYERPLKADNWDRALAEFTLAEPVSGIKGRLEEIEIPVLLVTGDSDEIVPTEDTVALADEFKNAEVAVIPRCGHLPHEERPSLFLKEVMDFLR